MGIEVIMIFVYVDDVRIFCRALRRGVKFCSSCKKLHNDGEGQGEETWSGTVRTAKLVGEVMNTLDKDLQFTTETTEDFESGTRPTLDYQVWREQATIPIPTPGTPIPREDQKVDLETIYPYTENTRDQTITQPTEKITQFRYKYFEKPMSTRYVTLETSASGWEQKKASLAQETARRLETTSEELDTVSKVGIINDFHCKLKRSGYSKRQISEIIISGITGHVRKMRQRDRNNMRGCETESARRRKKLTGRTSW